MLQFYSFGGLNRFIGQCTVIMLDSLEIWWQFPFLGIFFTAMVLRQSRFLHSEQIKIICSNFHCVALSKNGVKNTFGCQHTYSVATISTLLSRKWNRANTTVCVSFLRSRGHFIKTSLRHRWMKSY